MQRPVGLDEAATHHLRSRLAAPPAPAPAPEPAAPTAAPIAITAGHTAGHAQQAQQPVSTGAHAAVAEHSARVSSLAGRAQQDQTPAAG